MATVVAPRAVRPVVSVATRPASCASVAVINAAVGRLEVAFHAEPDSDKRATLIDTFINTPGFYDACLSPTQAARVFVLTTQLQGQAKKELASFPSNPLVAIAQVLELLVKPSTWVRAGEVIGGGVLVYMGLRTVLRELGGPALPTVAAAAARLRP